MTLSLMSTRTENIAFNRLLEAGSHWDRWVKCPFYPGYSAVGVVDSIAGRPPAPFLWTINHTRNL
jgi:hypothetical protein